MNTTNIRTKIKYNYTSLKSRVKANEPLFFIKLKKTAYKIGGSAAAILTANSGMSLNLNSTFVTAIIYVIVVCVTIAGTAKLTTE